MSLELTSPLARHLAAALRQEAPTLAAHWQERGRSAAPRFEDGSDPLVAHSEEVIAALAGALEAEEGWQERVMLAGWEYGTAAHVGGLSLHALLKEVNLLLAILLYALERAAAPPGGTVADALFVARRLHHRLSLLSLAASKGYTHVYVRGRRGYYRTLRHDLRNPIGTIQSAAALMQDETIPEAQRHDPRYPAMVARNARALENMVGRQLADDLVMDRELAVQAVPLRDLLLAVRRAVREDVIGANCEIVVNESMPAVKTDAVGLELALRAMLSAALRAAAAGTVLHLAAVEQPADDGQPAGVRLTLHGEPALALGDGSLFQRAQAIAEHAGAQLQSTATVVELQIPGTALQLPTPSLGVPLVDTAPPSRASGRHPLDDVRGSGERLDG